MRAGPLIALIYERACSCLLPLFPRVYAVAADGWTTVTSLAGTQAWRWLKLISYQRLLVVPSSITVPPDTKTAPLGTEPIQKVPVSARLGSPKTSDVDEPLVLGVTSVPEPYVTL